MKIIKGTFILFVLVFILIMAQMFRLNVHVQAENNANQIENEYQIENAIKLLDQEKNIFSVKPYLILYNSSYIHDLQNIKTICDYLKVDYRVEEYSSDIDYSVFKSIIMLEQVNTEGFDIVPLLDYVENGGRLIYLGNGNLGDDDLLKLYPEFFGITKWYTIMGTNSVYFNTDILLGIQGFFDLDENDLPDYKNFEYLDVDLAEEAIVHMEVDSGSPLIWEYNVGLGKIVVLNIGRYESKETRGLIVGALSLSEDLLIYPIIDSIVIFIDDFPADYNSNQLLIKKNYGRNFERFIKEIWWPDMLDLMKSHNLIYTSAFIQTYNDVVSGPFEYNEMTKATTIELASELLNNGGEVSFHGYNHQSLLFNQLSSSKIGYKAWPNENNIIASIEKSLKDFKEIFPNYEFYTYVPPSNLIDKKAISSLKKAIPTLKTISGLYFGEIDEFGRENQDTLVQEIGVNREYNLVDLPRITSGSFLHDNAYYRIGSSITLHGLVNHFIHPDDILDPDRSHNLLWAELFQETEKYFDTIGTQYPWLDKSTASSAAEKVKQVYYSKIYYELVDNKIKIACDNFDKEITLILATNKEVISSTDCNFEKIGTNRYLIKMHKNKALLEVR